MIRFRWLALSLVGLLVLAAAASACPFCPSQGRTLSSEVDQANLILYGTLENAKRDPNEFGKGTTDLKIDVVVKDHAFRDGKMLITLPRYVPPDPKTPRKFLVFCEIYNGQLDPYRGEAVNPDSKIADYLKGAIAIRNKEPIARLKYFFQYLDSPEIEISQDAFAEFAVADYKDVSTVASSVSPEILVKWLKDANTSPARFGLYGYMLGLCGNAKEHAPILREMLDDPKRKYSSGLDGMLYGYILLDPKTGWQYLTKLITDPESEFLTRYAALRTIRTFWENRRETVGETELLSAMMILATQGDIADLPIEDLRRWGRWELTDKILAMYGHKTHNVPIVKRSIIRFALTAPNHARAAEFVKARRAEDPDRVKDIENLLELEKPAATPDPKSDPKK